MRPSFVLVILALVAPAVPAAEPDRRTYENRLTLIANAKPLLADHPTFVISRVPSGRDVQQGRCHGPRCARIALLRASGTRKRAAVPACSSLHPPRLPPKEQPSEPV